MHVLKIGCRWQDCPREYGPPKTIYNRFSRWSEKGVWQKIFECVAGPSEPPESASLDSTHVKIHRCANGGKGGADFEAIGLTKGGRNSKVHAVVDEHCRPWAFVLTPGNIADCVIAEECVSLIPGIKQLLADKGYDTNAIRNFLKKHGVMAVIPGKSNRKKENLSRQKGLQGPQCC